ncbi:MAG: hypothetical protein NC338_08365, partial [Firmicutes bacterium]|nr:hypothetical protein [Bacillota bacterium]MCM1402018.1 hypothetical protein [Bacteroides sp.]MCM1477947.1 hypothetical protein [Bacteroides sp.]
CSMIVRPGFNIPYRMDSKYTVATASDGRLTITVIDDEDHASFTRQATQTGNTLLVGTRLYTRK